MANYTDALETVGAFNATFYLKGALRAASDRIRDVRLRWPGVRCDPDDGSSMRCRCVRALAGCTEIDIAVDTIIGSLAEAHP